MEHWGTGAPRCQPVLAHASTSVISLAGGLAIVATNGLATNATFVIITNSGSAAVSGTFVRKPQGFTFSASGYWWRMNCTGGSGNDVTLTIVAPPKPRRPCSRSSPLESRNSP